MTPESWVKDLRAKIFWVRKFQTRTASWKENEDGGRGGDEWTLNGPVPGFQMFLQKEYLKLSYPVTQWVRKKKRPTASLFEATWIYWKWLSGRTEGWGSSLSHTPPHPPTTHAHIQELSIDLVKCLSFCPKQVNPGSKVLPFMLSSCFFLFKIKTTTFSKKGKQRKIE